MDFDYSINGMVQIALIPYSRQKEHDFPKPMTSTAPPLVADHLFQVRPDDEQKTQLEKQARAFHRSTAQLLFLSKRAHPDLQTLFSFLTKRVRSPDEDDWGKLK